MNGFGILLVSAIGPEDSVVEYFFSQCTYAEAWEIVTKYHYSRTMRAMIIASYGYREKGGLFGDYGKVIACVVFSLPIAGYSKIDDVIEVHRLIKIDGHNLSLSSLLSKSMPYILKKGFHLAISYADKSKGHHGGIYQASSWNYARDKQASHDGLIIDGKFIADRNIHDIYGTHSISKIMQRYPQLNIERHYDEGKYLYWKALSRKGKALAKQMGLESNPYPKPDWESTEQQVAD